MSKKVIFENFSSKLRQTAIIVFVVIPMVVFYVIFSKKGFLEVVSTIINGTDSNKDNGSFTGYIWLIHNTPLKILPKIKNIKLLTIKYVICNVFNFWNDEDFVPIWK